MKKIAIALLALLVISVPLFAHEGHDHKVMGTVAAVQDRRVDVKGADAKTSTVTLDDKTRILRGKTPAKATDIRVGDRIVVTGAEAKDKDGKVILLAKEVLLGAAPAAVAAGQ